MNPRNSEAQSAERLQLATQQRILARGITMDTVPHEANDLLRPTPQGGMPRLDIYRHAFRARLADALRENFPVLHRVLGDDDFDGLAERFIAGNPSQHHSIRWFGNALPDWLAAREAQLPHPALVDLARMEWALGTAFDAADDMPLSAEQLLAVAPSAWPELRLSPRDSLRVTALAWAVEPLWRAITDDADAETEAPEAHPHTLLTWRHRDQTQWRSAAPLEARLLLAAAAGKSFAELCELAGSLLGDTDANEVPATVAGYLRVWVDAGLIAG
jgi:hypothetical protein